MIAGIYIDPAEEYEAIAEQCARIYGCPIDPQWVQALLVNVPEHVIESIESAPHEWAQRVHEYVHGMDCE